MVNITETKERVEMKSSTAILVVDTNYIIIGTEHNMLCAVPWRWKEDANEKTMKYIDKLFIKDNKHIKNMIVVQGEDSKSECYNMEGELYYRTNYGGPFDEEGEFEFPCPEKFAEHIIFSHPTRKINAVKFFEVVQKMIAKKQITFE